MSTDNQEKEIIEEHASSLSPYINDPKDNAGEHAEMDEDDKDDPYLSKINFRSIRTTDGLETAIRVQWLDVPETKLRISTLLQQEDIAPLFAGAQWAGTRVWHAAIAMVDYLVREHEAQLQDGDTKLLELGCGLGVPGMLCHALYNTETYLTDQEEIMSQLETNVEDNFFADHAPARNEPRRLHAKALNWSREALLEDPEFLSKGSFIVMNCDCVYEPLYGESWKLLADVLETVLELNPNTLVLTSVERRNADGVEKFLAKMLASPHIASVEKVWFDEEYKIEIYRARGVM
jgi:hypothetical protein